MKLIPLLFSPQGRIAPQTFWLGFAILSVVSIAVLFIPAVGPWLWLMTFVPWTMLTTKRLHDLGKSGWVQLVVYVGNLVVFISGVALIGAAAFLTVFQKDIVQSTLDAGAAAGAGGGLMLTGGIAAFNTIWLIWLGGSPGTVGKNRYGNPTDWPY